VEEVRRMNQLVRDLLDYARPLEVERRDVGVGELLDRAMAEVGLPRDGVEVALDLDGDCHCLVDPLLLVRVLVNLLSNSIEAMADGCGQVEVMATCGDRGDVVIEVRDDGVGLAAEDLPQLFTPFFSRKEAGIGMGLCLSRRIMEQHGGTLELRNAAGRGVVARLELPRGEEDR